MIEHLRVGTKLNDIEFYSPFAMFQGAGIVTSNTKIATGPKRGDFSLDIKVTIAVDEDIQKVRQILLGLGQDDDRYMKTPAPRVLVTELKRLVAEGAIVELRLGPRAALGIRAIARRLRWV